MTFDEIKIESKKDLVIHEDDLGHMSAITPELNHKYLMELYSSKEYLHKLEYQYKVLFKDKWLYYSGKSSAAVYEDNPFDLKVLKSDLQIFFDADKELSSSMYKINYVRNKIECITKIIDELNRRTWTISNMIKHQKFISGEM